MVRLSGRLPLSQVDPNKRGHMNGDRQSQPMPSWLTATLDDVQHVDIERPIADARAAESYELSRLFLKAANSSKQADQTETNASRVYGMLSAVTEMHFKPDERNEPFGPMMQFADGRRTAIPSDFRARIDVLASMVECTQNPVLRARLADVSWLLDRKRAKLGL